MKNNFMPLARQQAAKTEGAYIECLKQDRKQAFACVFTVAKDEIYRYIFYRIRNKDLVEDLVQETFIKTWKYLNDNDWQVDNIRAFIFKVAKNLISDHYQNEQKMAEFDVESVGKEYFCVKPNLDEKIDFRRSYEKIASEISRLDSKHRRMIHMRFIQEMEIDEIHELTGKSPNYISVLIYQGLKRIRERTGRDKHLKEIKSLL